MVNSINTVSTATVSAKADKAAAPAKEADKQDVKKTATPEDTANVSSKLEADTSIEALVDDSLTAASAADVASAVSKALGEGGLSIANTNPDGLASLLGEAA